MVAEEVVIALRVGNGLTGASPARYRFQYYAATQLGAHNKTDG